MVKDAYPSGRCLDYRTPETLRIFAHVLLTETYTMTRFRQVVVSSLRVIIGPNS